MLKLDLCVWFLTASVPFDVYIQSLRTHRHTHTQIHTTILHFIVRRKDMLESILYCLIIHLLLLLFFFQWSLYAVILLLSCVQITLLKHQKINQLKARIDEAIEEKRRIKAEYKIPQLFECASAHAHKHMFHKRLLFGWVFFKLGKRGTTRSIKWIFCCETMPIYTVLKCWLRAKSTNYLLTP